MNEEEEEEEELHACQRVYVCRWTDILHSLIILKVSSGDIGSVWLWNC